MEDVVEEKFSREVYTFPRFVTSLSRGCVCESGRVRAPAAGRSSCSPSFCLSTAAAPAPPWLLHHRCCCCCSPLPVRPSPLGPSLSGPVQFLTLPSPPPPPGSSWAQDLLPDGPVDAVLGRNVTLKTLVKPVYTFIVWNFNDGTEQVHIATRTATGLNTNDMLYKDRVSVDPVTGSLTLTALRANESGDYSITIITQDGSTTTAEIKLRVLGE